MDFPGITGLIILIADIYAILMTLLLAAVAVWAGCGAAGAKRS